MTVPVSFIFLIMAMWSAHQHPAEDMSPHVKNQLKPLALVQTMALNYADRFFTTFAHECGHALAAKIINDDPLNIHIGGSSECEPLFNVGEMLYIHGFHPGIGYAKVKKPLRNAEGHLLHLVGLFDEYRAGGSPAALVAALSESNQHIHAPKRAAILLAGGVAGILGHFMFKTMRNWLVGSENLGQAMRKARALDAIYLDQLFNMLAPLVFPGGLLSDGALVLEDCFGMSRHTTERLSSVSAVLVVIATLTVIYQKSASIPPDVAIPLCVFNILTDNNLDLWIT